jgi:hypothetical protein
VVDAFPTRATLVALKVSCSAGARFHRAVRGNGGSHPMPARVLLRGEKLADTSALSRI